jgi:hypothetical protein
MSSSVGTAKSSATTWWLDDDVCRVAEPIRAVRDRQRPTRTTRTPMRGGGRTNARDVVERLRDAIVSGDGRNAWCCLLLTWDKRSVRTIARNVTSLAKMRTVP